MNFRQIVTNELERQGISRYKLWQMVKPEISQPHIYDWLNGKYNLSDNKLGVIFDALGIEINCSKAL